MRCGADTLAGPGRKIFRRSRRSKTDRSQGKPLLFAASISELKKVEPSRSINSFLALAILYVAAPHTQLRSWPRT